MTRRRRNEDLRPGDIHPPTVRVFPEQVPPTVGSCGGAGARMSRSARSEGAHDPLNPWRLDGTRGRVAVLFRQIGAGASGVVHACRHVTRTSSHSSTNSTA